MNKTTIFYAGIAVAVIALLIAVYYVIPGVYHVLASDPTKPHYKHAVAFVAIAVIAALAAVINRPRSAATRY
ncbi:MAG: hypothetical protein NVS4B11_38990 [Ktedonobacteraceae bacterium]